MCRARAFAEREPERYLELRYEEMSRNAALAAETAFRFLGVAATPEIAASCSAATAFEVASGGRQRGEENIASFFRKGVTGDWRTHLAADAARRFAVSADGWLARMGYGA